MLQRRDWNAPRPAELQAWELPLQHELVDHGIQDEIDALTAIGRTPAQVHKELRENEAFRARLPSLRTIQRLAKASTPEDPSGQWSVAAASDDELTAVPPVLAAVIEKTEGTRTAITQAEARHISHIAKAAPDLTPWETYFLARLYVKRGEDGDPVDDLDAFVAFAPWRAPENLLRYESAATKGHVIRVPGPLLYRAKFDAEPDVVDLIDAASRQQLRSSTNWRDMLASTSDELDTLVLEVLERPRVDESDEEVAARLANIAGIRPLPPVWLARAYSEGPIYKFMRRFASKHELTSHMSALGETTDELRAALRTDFVRWSKRTIRKVIEELSRQYEQEDANREQARK